MLFGMGIRCLSFFPGLISVFEDDIDSDDNQNNRPVVAKQIAEINQVEIVHQEEDA